MNLFKDLDKVYALSSRLNRYIKSNGYRLLKREKKWMLFDKDELIVEIKMVTHDNKEKIELRSPLLDDVGYSIETFVKPICGEKFIRDIAKADLIGLCGCKIYLIRRTVLKKNFFENKTLDYNLNSIIKKSRKLQNEISSLLDYNMFVKLN